MFLGYYELEEKEDFGIYYYKNSIRYKGNEWEIWLKDTFSPNIKYIRFLDFTIKGKNYNERKSNLIEIAKEWQLDFGYLGWSYSEYAEIMNYFYKNAKRYGLLKEFRENGIC